MSDEQTNVFYGGADIPLIESDCRSMGEVILRKLAEHKDNVLVIDSASGKTLRANELLEQAVRLAHSLRTELQIGEGDVIGLCSENRPLFAVVVYASVLLGATLAPLNTTYSNDELIHAMHLSKPRVVFASGFTLRSVCAAVRRVASVQRIIALDNKNPERNAHVTALSAFQRSAANFAVGSFRSQPVDMRSNVLLILCSSGTTGLPKGVQLTQFNLHAATSSVNDTAQMFEAMGLEQPRTLIVVPWFHAYGITTLLTMTLCGQTLVTMARYRDRDFLRAIETHRCDLLLAVPPLLLMLAQSPAVDEYDLSSLRIVISGAAPLSAELAEAVRQRIPSIIFIMQGFGMSELTLAVLQQSPAQCTPGSVGVLRPGIWGKIVDPDTGATLAQGQRGEMCFRGAAVMKGYVGDGRATVETIDKDGWLHTGDIGYVTADGEWFIVDRLKELIKYKGYQVPPAELEALLLQHPAVADAGVIGVPDVAVGEKAVAFVVRTPNGGQLRAEDVEAFVAERVSPAKRLHGGVRFVKSIPKNVTGKILRRELRVLALKSKL